MLKMFRKHPKIKGYVLIADYPGNRRPIGYFEPYTTGLYSKFPHLWKPVYYKDVIRNEKLEKLGI
jgi:uncharacterized protein (DUF952 family)